MKADGPSSSADPSGDISPIAESLSNLPEASKSEGRVAETKKAPRKSEPASERLPNFSRVTPAQLAHVVFPAEARYQPVRPVSSQALKSAKGKASSVAKAPSAVALGGTAERYAGGGGILILIDQAPSEPVELVELEPVPAPAPPATEAAPATTTPAEPAYTGRHISLDENAPEADPPQSFEVCSSFVHQSFGDVNAFGSHSIPLVMIPRIDHSYLYSRSLLTLYLFSLMHRLELLFFIDYSSLVVVRLSQLEFEDNEFEILSKHQFEACGSI